MSNNGASSLRQPPWANSPPVTRGNAPWASLPASPGRKTEPPSPLQQTPSLGNLSSQSAAGASWPEIAATQARPVLAAPASASARPLEQLRARPTSSSRAGSLFISPDFQDVRRKGQPDSCRSLIMGFISTLLVTLLTLGVYWQETRQPPMVVPVNSKLVASLIFKDPQSRWKTSSRDVTSDLRQITMDVTKLAATFDLELTKQQAIEEESRAALLNDVDAVENGQLQDYSIVRGRVQRLREELGGGGAVTGRLKEMDALIATLEPRLEYAAADPAILPSLPGRFTDGKGPLDWKQRAFERVAAFGFVQFSSFRLSPSRFAVTGLAAAGMERGKRRFYGCWFIPKVREGGEKVEEGSGAEDHPDAIRGSVEVTYLSTQGPKYTYVSVVLFCQLKSPITRPGGTLRGKIDSEFVVLYVDDEHEPLDGPTDDPDAPPFPHSLSFCTAPVFPLSSPSLVYDWLLYHLSLSDSSTHSFFYDAGGLLNDDWLWKKVKPLLDSDAVTVTNFKGINHWNVAYGGKLLALNDCLLRSRPLSRWVLSLDFQEYLLLPPPLSLPSLLQAHSDKALITHGCSVYNIHKCRSEINRNGQELAVEKMVYRWPEIFCKDEGAKKGGKVDKCGGAAGHRRFFANPRKVEALDLYGAVKMDGEAVDISTNEMRHANFVSLLKKNAAICINSSTVSAKWVKSEGEIANAAKAARECTERLSRFCSLDDIKTVPA